VRTHPAYGNEQSLDDTMSFTINGFGTTYYGECDFRADGSFVTTEWFVMAYLPVFPLHSKRVIRAAKGDVNLLVYQSRGFVLVEDLPRNWRQAFATYGFVLAMIALVIGVLHLPWPWSSHPTLFLIFDLLLLASPFVFLSVVRSRAQKRAGFSSEALAATVGAIQSKTRRGPVAPAAPPPLPRANTFPPALPTATGE
jgi:hypothetical protein